MYCNRHMEIINIQIFYCQQMSNTVSNMVTPLVHLFWEPPICYVIRTAAVTNAECRGVSLVFNQIYNTTHSFFLCVTSSNLLLWGKQLFYFLNEENQHHSASYEINLSWPETSLRFFQNSQFRTYLAQLGLIVLIVDEHRHGQVSSLSPRPLAQQRVFRLRHVRL